MIVVTFFYFDSEFEIFGILGGSGFIEDENKENVEIILSKKPRFWEHKCALSILMIMSYLLCQDCSSRLLFTIGVCVDFLYYALKVYCAN
jgi:hypothetical protein